MPKTAKHHTISATKQTMHRRQPKRPPIPYLGYGSELAIEFRNRALIAETEADYQWLHDQAANFLNRYIDGRDDMLPLIEAAAWQLQIGEDTSDILARIIAGELRLAMLEAFERKSQNSSWPTVPAYADGSNYWRPDTKTRGKRHGAN